MTGTDGQPREPINGRPVGQFTNVKRQDRDDDGPPAEEREGCVLGFWPGALIAICFIVFYFGGQMYVAWQDALTDRRQIDACDDRPVAEIEECMEAFTRGRAGG